MTRRASILLCFAVVLIDTACVASRSQAEAGDFWYGLYGVTTHGRYGTAVYDSLRTVYKMNWLYGDVNNVSELALAAAKGLRVINLPDSLYTGEMNRVLRYSASHFLRYQLEGDTVVPQQ